MNTRKPYRSMLDPFRDKLLQMDQDKITIKQMLPWLRARQMRCSRGGLRHFLNTRRAEHNHNHRLACVAPGAGQGPSAENNFPKNPAPEIG